MEATPIHEISNMFFTKCPFQVILQNQLSATQGHCK